MSTETRTQYTPGPWKYDPYWSLIHGPKGVEIAAIHAATQQGEKRARPDIARANAVLIATAPELVDALRLGLRAMRNLGWDESPSDTQLQAWFNQAYNAYTKAIGDHKGK